MTEGVIVSWLKKPGDKVKSGDILAEVETDKATMELESYSDGVLLHIGVNEGDSVPVNGVLAVIGKEGEDFKALLEKEQSAGTGTEEKSAEPPAGEQKAGSQSQKEQPQKEQPAQNEDQVKEQPAQPEPPKPDKQAGATAASDQKVENEDDTQDDARIKASPLAKKIANEKGINLSGVKGSGDYGRIVRRDIEEYTEQPASQQAQQPGVSAGEEAFEDHKVSQMRKTIARRLAESKFGAPHFYLTIEVNMERTVEARSRINDILGEKVSFNDIIIKSAAAALRKHPKVNSSWLGDKIRQYSHIHIGVAMAVDDGLVVPVLRFADTKGIGQLSREVKGFAEKAKNKKLQPHEFEGNTFTISNLGMFGIEEFTAIINPPDACILAVGAIQEKPIVKNGEITIGSMMKLTLSCDHRVVDGATGAQFLQTLKQYLEEPVTILA